MHGASELYQEGKWGHSTSRGVLGALQGHQGGPLFTNTVVKSLFSFKKKLYCLFQKQCRLPYHRCHRLEDFSVLSLCEPASRCIWLETRFSLGTSARAWREGTTVSHQPYQVTVHKSICLHSPQQNNLGTLPANKRKTWLLAFAWLMFYEGDGFLA